MNRLCQDKREGIVHSLTECMSQRACERIYKVSNKTVAKLANDVGDIAIHHMASIRGLKATRVQADELWSFVKVKAKNIHRQKIQEVGVGSVWTYLAICDDSKFIIDYALGDRKRYCTLTSGNWLEVGAMSPCRGAPRQGLPILVFHGVATQPWSRANGQTEG